MSEPRTLYNVSSISRNIFRIYVECNVLKPIFDSNGTDLYTVLIITSKCGNQTDLTKYSLRDNRPNRPLPALQRRRAQSRQKENAMDDGHYCDRVHRLLDAVQCNLLLVLAGQGHAAEDRSACAEATVLVRVHQLLHESDCVRPVQHSAAAGDQGAGRHAHEPGECQLFHACLSCTRVL